MTQQQGTPPGWYPDPATPGMVRWWDGSRWADARQPAMPPVQRRKHKGPRIMIGGAVFFAVCLVVVMVLQYSGDAGMLKFSNGMWTISIVLTLLIELTGGIVWIVEASKSPQR